jgi:hypothetical protein
MAVSDFKKSATIRPEGCLNKTAAIKVFHQKIGGVVRTYSLWKSRLVKTFTNTFLTMLTVIRTYDLMTAVAGDSSPQLDL